MLFDVPSPAEAVIGALWALSIEIDSSGLAWAAYALFIGLCGGAGKALATFLDRLVKATAFDSDETVLMRLFLSLPLFGYILLASEGHLRTVVESCDAIVAIGCL